jgi:hypothetical protein
MTIVERLYQKLCSDVQGKTGHVTISLAGVTVNLTGRDAIGHLVQEWLFSWCNSNGFSLTKNAKTQTFPDYFIGVPPQPLEIKNFNFDANPAFDVADFYAFIETLPDNIEKLYADYIIFGYCLNQTTGALSIPKIWKFKIWELVGKSPTNFINCQIRGDNGNKRIQKLRPRNFKNPETDSKFQNPLEFLTELQKLLNHNDATRNEGYSNWLDKVKDAHIKKYEKPLQ